MCYIDEGNNRIILHCTCMHKQKIIMLFLKKKYQLGILFFIVFFWVLTYGSIEL